MQSFPPNLPDPAASPPAQPPRAAPDSERLDPGAPPTVPTATEPSDLPAPRVLARAAHSVSRRDIDPDALAVLYRLHRARYLAYLVGGSVRDLLLGRRPKDFDIATSAHPRAVQRLFERCFLIGRRFRLAHVHRNGKIFEVSTFRSRASEEQGDGDDPMIRRDNTFGTPAEDSLRRDFTINGLFYDIGTFSVIDYVGGLEDLEAKRLRTIGDAEIRVREDPVRIIRAAKFAARLGFSLEPTLDAAMRRHHLDIAKCSMFRVREELMKILHGGASDEAFGILEEVGILRVLLPEVVDALEVDPEHEGERFHALLHALDEDAEFRARLTPAVFVSVLLACLARGTPAPGRPETLEGWRNFDGEPELFHAIESAARRLETPKAVTARVVQVLRAQRRFHQSESRSLPPLYFASRNYFPEALLYFELEVRAGLAPRERLDDWMAAWEEVTGHGREGDDGEDAAESPPPRSSHRFEEVPPPPPRPPARPAHRETASGSEEPARSGASMLRRLHTRPEHLQGSSAESTGEPPLAL